MCKMEKVTTFTQFEQKITHISGCKLVYKYTIVTVTVHSWPDLGASFQASFMADHQAQLLAAS